MTETTAKKTPRVNPVRLIIAGFVFLLMIGAIIWFLMQLTSTSFNGASNIHIDIPRNIQTLALDGTNGAPITINDLTEGRKYTLMSFGYTHCPDVCPLTLTEYKRVKRELSETEAERLNFLFVSVDGTRDTPELLNRYVSRFDPEFLGASTQDDSLMQQFTDAFSVFYEIREVENTAAPYLVDHTATLFLLGPSGDVVASYPFGTPALEIAADIQNRL